MLYYLPVNNVFCGSSAQISNPCLPFLCTGGAGMEGIRRRDIGRFENQAIGGVKLRHSKDRNTQETLGLF